MSSSPSASMQDAALITTASHPTPSPPIAAENGLTPPQLPASASAPPTAQETPADALAIAELCLLAGVPERTAEFLANATPAAQVRQLLLQSRAEQPQIVSRITAQASTEAAGHPLITAVKKMIGKE